MKIIRNQAKIMTIQNKYALHEQNFLAYIEPFLQKSFDPCLVLKKEHTFHVVKNTETILQSLSLSEEDKYCAKLIALYHDIGRFLQYEKYQTFLDKKSEDHANIAVRVLKQQTQFLAEPVHIQKKVLTAVILHNKLKIPHQLPDCYKDLCKLIRDADKIDILRVLSENFTSTLPEKERVLLHSKDEPLLYSQHILDRAMQKKENKYTDIVYVNDFKIIVCAWLFAINYPQSIKMLREQGYIQTILATLPKTKEIEAFKTLIHSTLTA